MPIIDSFHSLFESTFLSIMQRPSAMTNIWSCINPHFLIHLKQKKSLKITIIGCGWLGLPLGKELLKQGHSIAGSTQSNEKLKKLEKLGISSFHYSLDKNTEIPSEVCSSTEILIITIPPLKREKDPKLYGGNLKKLVKQFTGVRRVIFTSSIGIYPQRSTIYFEHFEFLEQEKNTVLFQAEHALTSLLKNKLIILRLGGLIGDGRHPVNYLQGRDDVENPFGLVNLIHQTDVIRCIQQCIENADVYGIYNVVNPENPWRKEYYTKLYRQHGLKAINFVMSPTIERHIDTTKLRQELGFSFNHSIYDLSDCGLD